MSVVINAYKFASELIKLKEKMVTKGTGCCVVSPVFAGKFQCCYNTIT